MAEQRLIDLDKAMEATRKEIYWTESRAADVRSFLILQPRVDAVPVVHGRWAKIDDGLDLWHKCSVCGSFELSARNYCPNCGAKMDGGTDNV